MIVKNGQMLDMDILARHTLIGFCKPYLSSGYVNSKVKLASVEWTSTSTLYHTYPVITANKSWIFISYSVSK
jgi:hypothetical protein